MKYECRFYRDEDFDTLEQLILHSYQWEYPIWGLSRHEFCKGLHPAFTGNHHAWKHTVGVFREQGKPVAGVINEGTYDGNVFFLFDSPARGQDPELLKDMIHFARTYAAGIGENRRTRHATVHVPKWNAVLADILLQSGFKKEAGKESHLILPFGATPFEVNLPEGYTMTDGHTTPAFYLSNIHRHSFAYGGESHACEHGAEAFDELRKMKHYCKHLDLCVLDPQQMPIAMAIIWHDEAMPYCELEPMGVVWWERRKGIGRALLHEAANRVMQQFPDCTGMLGGNQDFYSRLGYEKKAETDRYYWELDIIISWEKESFDKDYATEV
jgi:predicted N-acetyltransferase YhbS